MVRQERKEKEGRKKGKEREGNSLAHTLADLTLFWLNTSYLNLMFPLGQEMGQPNTLPYHLPSEVLPPLQKVSDTNNEGLLKSRKEIIPLLKAHICQEVEAGEPGIQGCLCCIARLRAVWVP